METITTGTLDNKTVPFDNQINSISRVYLLISRFFTYPEKEFCDIMKEDWMKDRIKGLVKELPFEMDFAGIPCPSLSQDDFESHYINVFDITPVCSLYESGYRMDELSQRDVQEEIFRFYGYFDVKLSNIEKDYPDHLITELEFMAYLSQKQADSKERRTLPDPYSLAQLDFLDRHLNRWIPKFNERIQKRIKETFYKSASSFMAEFLMKHTLYLKKLKIQKNEVT